jgi:hypothetical protein
MLKNRVRIKFDDEYLQLFSNLEKDYITMWSGDIFQMRSARSIEFYEQLRLYTEIDKDVSQADVGIRWFKELFDIPKDGPGSYMREKGGFDRNNFERKVIDPLCEDIAKCKMINLVLQPDGKYYEKLKRNGRVEAYRFNWTYSSHPRVATAQEVKQIQERVDKDPEVLKVMKDRVHGEKKSREKPEKPKKKPKNKFCDYEQRTGIDWDQVDANIRNNDLKAKEAKEE